MLIHVASWENVNQQSSKTDNSHWIKKKDPFPTEQMQKQSIKQTTTKNSKWCCKSFAQYNPSLDLGPDCRIYASFAHERLALDRKNIFSLQWLMTRAMNLRDNMAEAVFAFLTLCLSDALYKLLFYHIVFFPSTNTFILYSWTCFFYCMNKVSYYIPFI